MKTSQACPDCGSLAVHFSEKRNSHVCIDCGVTFEVDQLKEKRNFKIFLSYGHDIFAEDVKMIKEDLEGRGHQVWYDTERLRVGVDFASYVEQGLKWCDKVVLIMTPHSVRRQDPTDVGFCLNEIAKALEFHKLIIPVYLVTVPGGTPLPISHLFYLDMRDCVHFKDLPEKYRARLRRLVDAIENDHIDFEGSQSRLIKLLEPLSFDIEMGRHLPRFSGREWIGRELDKWLVERPSNRVFWLLGDAGVGKSAVACHWIHTRGDVIAYHLCVHGNSDKADPKRILLSLIGQMAGALPKYFKRLSELSIEEEVKKNAKTIFDNLILAPFRRDFPAPDGDRLVIIDALDEANRGEENELAAFIAESWGDLPRWLRLVVTSRPNPNVVAHLSVFDPFRLRTNRRENLDDIHSYLRRELLVMELEPSDSVLDQIVDKSEGLFLYAQIVLDEIRSGKLSLKRLSDFPEGLTDYYRRWFTREFPDTREYQEKYHQVVSAIVAQRAPLPLEILAGALELNLHKLRHRLSRLSVLFPITPDRSDNRSVSFITALHKSLCDWLCEQNPLNQLPKAGPFSVDVAMGDKLFAQHGWSVYQAGTLLENPYYSKTLLRHLAAAGKHDEMGKVMLDPTLLDSLWSGKQRCEWQRHTKHLRGSVRLENRLRQWLETQVSEEPRLGKVAATAAKLSWLLQETGAWDEAIFLANEAIRLWESEGVTDSPDMLQCLLAMGCIHRGRDEREKATKRLEHGLTIAEHAYGPENRETADVLYQLCILYTETRQFKKAWTALERCQKIWEECDPPDYTWIATCVNDRAILLSGEGKPEDYLNIYKEALSLFEKAERDGHPEMAIVINNIAQELEQEGKFEEAISHYRRSLAMAESFMMPHSHRCQQVRERLAMALIRFGKYEEAVDLMRDSVQQHEIFPGPDHDDTASAKLSFCASIAYALWLNEEAFQTQLRREVRSIFSAVRKARPSTCLGFLRLSSDFHQIRESELSDLAIETAKRASRGNADREWKEPAECQSAQIFAEVLEEVVSGTSMSEVIRRCQKIWEVSAPIMREHADCLARTRRQTVGLISWTAQERLKRERDPDSVRDAFDLVSQLGSDTTETLVQLAILTLVLHNEHFYEVSEKLCEKLLERSAALLGADHHQTLTYIANLADLRIHRGDLIDGERLYRKAFDGHRTVFGAIHNNTISNLTCLVENLLFQGKTEQAYKLVGDFAQDLPDTTAGASARRVLARYLNGRAMSLKNEFRAYEAARHCYELAIGLAPDCIQHSNFALLLWSCLGDMEKAAQHFEKALAIDPEQGGVHSNYGLFLTHERQDRRRAKEHLEKALTLMPHDAAAYGNYATLAIIEGNLDKAWELSKRAMNLSLHQRDRIMTRPLFCAATILLLQGQDPAVPLGQLKQLFSDGINHVAWIITALLAKLDHQLNPTWSQLIRGISDAIADKAKLEDLENMLLWKSIKPIPLDMPWPEGQ